MSILRRLVFGSMLFVLVGCAMRPAPTTRPSVATTAPAAHVEPFALGADISWTLEDEAQGAQYFDGGVRKDLVAILRDHGFNWIRLRLFVDPKQGYARRREEAFCDLPHTIAMARRARAAGMKVLLDIHYSDTWADPEHQVKPAAWANLSLPELITTVHDYSRDVVAQMRDAGVAPDMVGVGNETTHGMLWPDGRVWSQIPSGNAQTDANNAKLGDGLGHYDAFADLLKAGIAGVHEAEPGVPILLHNHLGRHAARVREWLDELTSRGVAFDVVGFSCYAQGKEGDWQRTFADVAEHYPKLKIAVAEYSARKRYVNDLVHAIPDGRGFGTFIWEPTRHREALFDQDGKNAGGGQAYDFVADMGIAQGATSRPTSRPTTAPTSRNVNRGHGGRYDANAWLDLYPTMSRDYAR